MRRRICLLAVAALVWAASSALQAKGRRSLEAGYEPYSEESVPGEGGLPELVPRPSESGTTPEAGKPLEQAGQQNEGGTAGTAPSGAKIPDWLEQPATPVEKPVFVPTPAGVTPGAEEAPAAAPPALSPEKPAASPEEVPVTQSPPVSSPVREVTRPVMASPELYRVWIWQENGDCLWRIAEKVYGDRTKWRLIYLANRDIIRDPNKVYPKQKLKIPPPDWQP